AARLVQAASNLLNNAAKYTPPGGRIALRVRRLREHVELCVSDSGVGIPAHRIDEIFEMFTQVNDRSEGAKSGLGIGLTLVRKIVEMHGGTVEARSAGSGFGSEFIVVLPFAPVPAPDDSEAARAEEMPEGAPVVAAARRRILIVDDNVDAATGLELILRHHEHGVPVAPDGPSALGVAARFDPEIVLLDIGLPGMSGFEVARRLKALASGRAPPLLVATTGFGQAKDRRRAAEA